MKKDMREFIKEKTIELTKANGFNNVTIQDICKVCEITRPTFYKYAGSKEELILDLYDQTILNILHDPIHLASADSHYEQLLWVFAQIMLESKVLGSDLLSQMFIANMNIDHHSFDMRSELTELAIVILKKAQEKREIKNMYPARLLYHSIAYCFLGYEATWCIKDGNFAWEEDFFLSLNALLDVDEQYSDLYKKFIL